MGQPYIKIGEKFIEYRYDVEVQQEANGMVSCYIPAFDIYFSAPSRDLIEVRSRALINSFLNYWTKKEGWKQFILKIHKLGFKAPNHAMFMKEALNLRPRKATLHAGMVSSAFDGDIVQYKSSVAA